MPLKIVRNDITKMKTDAIVNTANPDTIVGPGCDYAIYEAAGYDELLNFRQKYIGKKSEGEVFFTPSFGLGCHYIIHAVSPRYIDGNSGEEEKLRACYHNSMMIARDLGVRSIAFPLISSGSFRYPKAEALSIATDEIKAFPDADDLLVYIVVFDEESSQLGKKIHADLQSYIDSNYVEQRKKEEYSDFKGLSQSRQARFGSSFVARNAEPLNSALSISENEDIPIINFSKSDLFSEDISMEDEALADFDEDSFFSDSDDKESYEEFYDHYTEALSDRLKHSTDTFSQYLLYLIDSKHLKYADVYKNALVDKKVFSKIKNDVDAHPKKLTVLCLCMGAQLNIDESKDLLARAGYAFSPCDKRDIIFSFFIENHIYDMVELDIQLEEQGLPCLIH